MSYNIPLLGFLSIIILWLESIPIDHKLWLGLILPWKQMLNHIKYIDNSFIMFGAKSLAKLCLSGTNVFSDVLAPNIGQSQ